MRHRHSPTAVAPTVTAISKALQSREAANASDNEELVEQVEGGKMVVASLQQVYEHIRHSILYLLWAAVYLYLLFVQQPLTYCFIAAVDWLWMRVPLRGARDFAVYTLKAVLKCISPQLFRRLLSREPFGPYCGADRELETIAQKQVPFHSVSLQGCAWMLPYHIGVCEGTF